LRRTNLLRIEILDPISWHVLGKTITDETPVDSSPDHRIEGSGGMLAELTRVRVKADGHVERALRLRCWWEMACLELGASLLAAAAG
jgi:hypothetical protein